MTDCIKIELLNIIQQHPKSYPILIKKNSKFVNWINKFSLVETNNFVEKLYSAIFQKDGICINGNKQKFKRFSRGYYGCGPASVCKCTQQNISSSVSKTKKQTSVTQQQNINQTRSQTMINRYGVAYNSQREELKHIWKRPKISAESYNKLIDYQWLDTEYNQKKRTATDIAAELRIYYSTVIEYCKYHNFEIRQRCNYSVVEVQIESYINSLGVKCETSNWNILQGKELDIVIPQYKLGIEVNGLYWHSYHPSTQEFEDIEKHLSKTLEAERKGYQLLHITDWHWYNKQEIVKSIIRTKLQLNTKIPARKCTLKKISGTQAAKFYNTYHLQGSHTSTYHLGLFYNNELVEAISVGHARYNKNYKWELHRLCSKSGITVVGGSGKLLKYAKELINNEPLLSYCDRDWSNGSGYYAMGFSLLKQSKPSYFWTDGTEILSREMCKREKVKIWLKNFNPEVSVEKNLYANKYRKFSTCGNLVFVL